MDRHFQAPIDLCCHIRPHCVLLVTCLPLEVATKVVDIAHAILDACPSVKHVEILCYQKDRQYNASRCEYFLSVL